MRSRRSWAFSVGALTLCFVLAQSASASFTSTPLAAATYDSAVLGTPVSTSASRGICVVGVNDSVQISWSQPGNNRASGYEVLRSTTSGSGYSVVGTINSSTTTTYTDSGLPFLTTYYYVVRATKNAWTSTNGTQVTITTRTVLCA